MNDDENFFGDDLPETSDDSTASRIGRHFKELMEAEEEQSKLEELSKNVSATIGKLKSETLPEILREMGTEIWRDPETGIAIELVTSVNSKLPQDRERRNEIFNALRPIGIEEILGEEYNVSFIPNDRRSAILRRFLGLPEPVVDVVEDEGSSSAPILTNEEVNAIEELREKLSLGAMPAEEKLGVHPSRLSSWLKKKIDGGEGERIRDAGIWHGKVANVNRGKKSGKK